MVKEVIAGYTRNEVPQAAPVSQTTSAPADDDADTTAAAQTPTQPVA